MCSTKSLHAEDSQLHTLVVVNIGKPGDNAWFDRLPRLDYDEVVTTV